MTAAERETGRRLDFLGAVRRAVAAPPGHVARPMAPLPHPLPPVAYAGFPHDDLLGAFGNALTALGAELRHIDSLESAVALIDEALDVARTGADRPVRVAISADPECVGIAEALAGRDDVEVLDHRDPHVIAGADLGITGARAGVALTGSLVVDAARAGGRTVSLLPPVHLALVDADAIVAAPGDVWRAIAEPMSSNVVQITGPSRSADIELIITLGVHGPRALMVGVLGSPVNPVEKTVENET